MSETVDTFNRLQREAEQLIRELSQAFLSGHMAYTAPAVTNRRFDGRFRALFSKFDQQVRLSPNARTLYQSLRQSVETQRQDLLRRAEAAYAQLPTRRETGLGGMYNSAVTDGLSQLPGAAADGMSQGIESLIGEMVKQAVDHPEVPGHVRSQMTRSLADWVRQQREVQDAMYFVQNVVSSVAQWLHHRLLIKNEIVRTRDQVRGRKEMSGAEAGQADQAVGTLAQRSQQLDQEIQQQLMRITGTFSFNPKLVLDPAKGFLDAVEVRAGIRMTTRDVKVDLGVGVKVVDPFSPDQVAINPGLNMQFNNGLQLGVEGRSGYDVNSQQWNHEVRATLRWTF